MKARWTDRALALAKQVPLRRLHPAALEAAPQGRWAVALSGGGDSVALLLLLWAHYPKKRARLLALHFDHRLRGAASKADARFCRKLCQGLKIEYLEGVWKDSPGQEASEAAARAARNDFFERACAGRRVKALWLGHQMDDIAETMLMRLARGSGGAGLAAPRPVSMTEGGAVKRLRPLLTVKKSEIAENLRRLKIAFRTDHSNAAGRFLRNRMRHSVVEAWRGAADEHRDPVAGAALSRELLEEDSEALEAWTERCHALTVLGRLNLTRLNGTPKAIVRRSLQRWVNWHLRDTQKSATGTFRLSRAGFERLLQSVLEGRTERISLGAAYFARIGTGWLTREGG